MSNEKTLVKMLQVDDVIMANPTWYMTDYYVILWKKNDPNSTPVVNKKESYSINQHEVYYEAKKRSEAFPPQRKDKYSYPSIMSEEKGNEFLVIDTNMTGGGTGMGNHDVYFDGHKVTMQRLKKGKYDPKGDTYTFYQSGSFNCMIKRVRVIRRMTQTFV